MPSSIICMSTLVTLLTTAGGTFSLTITGQSSVNGTRGGNVSITWNVQNIDSKTAFSVHINILEASENKLFNINELGVGANLSFEVIRSVRHDKIVSRSSAHYYYTGKSEGQETGQVVLTVTNLTLEDSDKFILRDEDGLIANYVTVLSVQYGPEKCGDSLRSKYIVNQGDQLNITMGFCGKPQPIVKCKFDGQPDTNLDGTEVNQHNYTYTFVPTNLKPCERKQLNCTATGHGKPITRVATVVANCLTPEKKEVPGGVCAGHIIGVEAGFIVICVFIYVYLAVWKATDETGKRVGFIIAIVVGLALVIGLSVSYAGLRKTNGNHNLETCDIAFIAFGVIDIVALVIVVIISVKVLKGNGSKTSHQPDKNRVEKVEVKKTGGATESPEQVFDQNV